MESQAPGQASNELLRNLTQDKIEVSTILRVLHPQKVRRRSPIYRKCEDLMELLWEEGYHKEITAKTLWNYVRMVCGGFRTTVQDYLGSRPKYYKSRGREGVLKTPAKKGYLEAFGFITLKNPRILRLHHVNVDRPYHWCQTNMVNFSLSNSNQDSEREEGAIAPIDKRTHTHHTKRERNRSSESILTHEELRILTAARSEGGGG